MISKLNWRPSRSPRIDRWIGHSLAGYNDGGGDTCERIYGRLLVIVSTEDEHVLSYADCRQDLAPRLTLPQ